MVSVALYCECVFRALESSPEKMPLNTTWRSWARSNLSPEIPVSVSHSSTGQRSVSPASTEEVDGNFDHGEGTASPTTEVGRGTGQPV